MSALCGIINFDAGPIDDEILMRVADGLDAYGPDGGAEVVLMLPA